MVFGLGNKKKTAGKSANAPTRGRSNKGMSASIKRYFFGLLSKYSSSQEEVVGIEITAKAIKVAQLNEKNDKWTLSKFSYRDVENGSEDLLRSDPDIYVDQINTALQMAKIDATNAAIALPVSSAIIRVLQMPIMTDEEMENAIATDSLWENLTQLPDALENYSIFHQIIKRHSDRNIMDVLFVASKIDDINLYADIVRKANLMPVIVDVRCFALRNAFETQILNQASARNSKSPVAILEISESENFILILQEETPYVVDIFIRPQDKELLSTMSVAMGGGYMDQLLMDVLNRFTVQIKQALAGFQNQYKSEAITSLRIVSPLPAIKGVKAELQKGLEGIDLEVYSPFEKLIIPQQLQEKTMAEENPSMFTAVIGLATRRLDVFGYFKFVTGVKNINLLPNRAKVVKGKQKDLYSKFIYIGVYLLLFGLLGFYGYLSYNKYQSNIAELSDYPLITQNYDNTNSNFQKLLSAKQGLEKDLSKGKELKSNSISSYTLFKEISQAVPSKVVLVGIRTSEENYNELVVEGQAVDDNPIIQLIDALNSRDTVQKASLVNMSVETMMSKSGQTSREIKVFEISVIANDEVINNLDSSGDE